MPHISPPLVMSFDQAANRIEVDPVKILYIPPSGLATGSPWPILSKRLVYASNQYPFPGPPTKAQVSNAFTLTTNVETGDSSAAQLVFVAPISLDWIRAFERGLKLQLVFDDPMPGSVLIPLFLDPAKTLAEYTALIQAAPLAASASTSAVKS